jgi:hypothetical protein
MDVDIVIEKPPFNSDSINPTLNGSCLEDLDAYLQELSEECKPKTIIYARIAVNASAIDQNTN